MAISTITRKEARTQGLKRYFTGSPCPKGHNTYRFVSTRGCVECARIENKKRHLPGGSRQPSGKRAAALKARLAARANGLTRYFSGEPCHVGHVAERYVSTSQCCDCLGVWKKNWCVINREQINARARADRAADPEKARLRTKKWQSTSEGRAVKALLQRERRARLRGSSGRHTQREITEILEAQEGRCAYCRTDVRCGYEVDHIISLKHGGSNDRRNIQIVCASCNRRKRTKDPVRFARDLGKLI